MFKEQVAEVIHLIKEKPEEALALAKSRQAEAQNSDSTPVTSPLIARKDITAGTTQQQQQQQMCESNVSAEQTSEVIIIPLNS